MKGYLPPKPIQPQQNFGEGVGSVAILIDTLRNTQKDVVQKVDAKISEIDTRIESADTILDQKIRDVDFTIKESISKAETTIGDTVKEALDYVKKIKVKDGDPGKDAEVDTKQIVKDVLAQIPEAPKLDENKLLKKFISKIPENKASLKIIQETFEVDPMSVIDKILALPKEKLAKLKLGTANIDGLDQTINAFNRQITSRGYLHGGGDTVTAGTNISITTNSAGQKVISSTLPVLAGVTSLNALTGAITLAAGTGITITPSGQTLTISGSATATLAAVSAASTDATKSLYTMTNAVAVEFKTAAAVSAWKISDTAGLSTNLAYAKFGNAAPFLAITTGVDIWGNDNTISGVQAGTGNRSSGASAYNGFFLNNDLAVSGDVTHFGFLGQNSSGYNDTTFGTATNVANLVFLQNTDGPISMVASKSSGVYFNWILGGAATTNEVMRLAMTTSRLTLTSIGTSSATNGLVVNTSAGVAVFKTRDDGRTMIGSGGTNVAGFGGIDMPYDAGHGLSWSSNGVAEIYVVRGTNNLTISTGSVRSLLFTSNTSAEFSDTNPANAFYSIGLQGGGATDRVGQSLALYAGAGAGTGAPGHIQMRTSIPLGASSSTTQTLTSRQLVGGFKALTNNTNTALVNLTLASNSVVAGIVRYSVEVFDGTDVQVEEGIISYHVTNKGGAFANNTTVKSSNQQAMTAGTLTVTWTITAANPAVLTINANSSLTPSAGYPRVIYNVDTLTPQAIAVQ